MLKATSGIRRTCSILVYRNTSAVKFTAATVFRSGHVANAWTRAAHTKHVPICQGCGSKITVDPTKPGYVEDKQQSPVVNSLNEKRAQEDAIFQRTMAAIGDLDKELLVPTQIDSALLRVKKGKTINKLCTRCHSLQHHTQLPATIEEEKISPFDIYSKIRRDPDALIVNVMDVMDMPLSCLALRRHIGTRPRIIHVINRVDILYTQPLAANDAKRRLQIILESAIQSGEKMDLRVISARKGWNVEQLANSLRTRRRGCNIYFAGSANAGKSSLISTLGRRSDTGSLQLPTVSHVPGTTLASIPTEIELFGDVLGRGKGSVVDLPGVLKPGFSGYITPDKLLESLPHKYIKANPMSLKVGESLILGDLIQLENVSESNTNVLVTPYMHLSPHKTSRPEHILNKPSDIRRSDTPSFETALEQVFVAEKGGNNILDLVFKDLGFVSVALWSGTAKIRVRTPGGLHCGVREPALIENSYEKK